MTETPLTDLELNEAVARKLGWKWYGREDAEGWYHLDKLDLYLKDLPDYCHSIAVAWEIVEKCLKPIGGTPEYDFELNHIDDENGWIASFVEQGELHGAYGSQGKADTAPMAICKAFLKLP